MLNWIFCCVICSQVIYVYSSCGAFTDLIPEAKVVKETQTGLLWSVVIDNVTTWTLKAADINGKNIPILYRDEVESYFDFNKTENGNSTNLTLTIVRPLDKEETFWKNILAEVKENQGLQRLDFELTCYDSDGTPVPLTIFFPIASVNEFEQTLKGIPPQHVPEDKLIGDIVLSVYQYIEDEDIPKPSITDFTYTIVNRTGVIHNDGSPWFQIPVASSDAIVLKTLVDFDSLVKQHKNILSLLIVITASDKPEFQVNTTVEINITDVDDQPPSFLYPGCDDSCPSTPFTALTYSNYKGILTIQPRDIKAQDQDTFNAPIEYSILALPTNYHMSFQIHPHTGVLKQVGNVNKSFVLEIKATEMTQNRHSQTAPVLITFSNDSIPAISLSQSKDDSSLLRLIAVIVGAVSLVVIAILIFVIIFVHKRSKKKMIITPQSEHIVSTKTSIEDLVSDKPETVDQKVTNWNDGSSTNLKQNIDANFKNTMDTNWKQTIDPQQWPTVQGRGNQLDPLSVRDESTETEEKKKKPRKKKKKLLEIFDGTNTFEDKADPEFYTNPDKTKIKRSTRSKNKRSENGILEVTSD